MRAFCSAILLAAFAAGTAGAVTIEDLVGDEDGFGIGVLEDEGVDYLAVGPVDEQETDVWRYGNHSVTHSYASPVEVLASATLEIFHGGVGFRQQLGQVYFDGVLLGSMALGDDVGPEYNYAKKDVFDLSSVLGLIDGSNVISFELYSGDGWVLDYSKLTIETVNSAPTPAPLPAGLPLLAGALGLMVLRARKSAA